MSECLIVGAGVVGLSLGCEIARQGVSVHIVDRQSAGREASWAGAGILPPANSQTAVDPLDRLRGLSHELHAKWADQLRDETGIDTGYRRCGGLYLARRAGEAAALAGLAGVLQELGIAVRRLTDEELVAREPALQALVLSGQLSSAYLLPEEAQLRNPDHLAALLAACRQRGVTIEQDVEARRLVVGHRQLQGVETTRGMLRAGRYCLAAGAWTYRLLRQIGIETGILPVRGQMVMYRFPRPPFSHVINEGSRYLVPRDDGRVLVGSTEEEAGFNKETTPDALGALQRLACELIPSFAGADVERSWAGLRPGTFDGLPYLGAVPGLDNLFVAAGHFRSGLQLSTGTAVVMAQRMLGQPTQIDLTPFRVGRG